MLRPGRPDDRDPQVQIQPGANTIASTHASILKRIVGGSLVQADETGVRLQRGKGYVWVLTNNLGVYYTFNLLSAHPDAISPNIISPDRW